MNQHRKAKYWSATNVIHSQPLFESTILIRVNSINFSPKHKFGLFLLPIVFVLMVLGYFYWMIQYGAHY